MSLASGKKTHSPAALLGMLPLPEENVLRYEEETVTGWGEPQLSGERFYFPEAAKA